MRDWEWFGLSIAVFDSHQRVEMSSKITIQRWKYPNLVPAVRPWLTHNAIWGKMGKIQRRVWYAGNHIPHIHYLIMWIPENRMVCNGTLKSAAPDPPPMQAATRHDRSQISRIFWDAIFVFRHLFVCLKIGYVYIHWFIVLLSNVPSFFQSKLRFMGISILSIFRHTQKHRINVSYCIPNRYPLNRWFWHPHVQTHPNHA